MDISPHPPGSRNTAGYTTGTGNLYSAAEGYTLTFDDAGNLATKSKTGEYWTYTWDNNNRLTDVKEYDHVGGTLQKEVAFKYDVLNNRVEKDVDGDGNGSFESIVKMAFDLNGNAWADMTSGGSLTTRRLYENAIDKLFARVAGSGNEDWYEGDLLGSVRDIIDYTGALTDHLDYDSYGKVTTETHSNVGDRYAWTSRERDSEINLQYNRARYYDPATGRWISQDPLGFDAGDGNLYRYVMNTPTTGVDSLGEQGTVTAQTPSVKAGPAPIPDINGGFFWIRNFQLDQATKNGGFVIQSITIDYNLTDANGNAIPQDMIKSWRNDGKLGPPFDYWEAWEVKKDQKEPQWEWVGKWKDLQVKRFTSMLENLRKREGAGEAYKTLQTWQLNSLVEDPKKNPARYAHDFFAPTPLDKALKKEVFGSYRVTAKLAFVDSLTRAQLETFGFKKGNTLTGAGIHLFGLEMTEKNKTKMNEETQNWQQAGRISWGMTTVVDINWTSNNPLSNIKVRTEKPDEKW